MYTYLQHEPIQNVVRTAINAIMYKESQDPEHTKAYQKYIGIFGSNTHKRTHPHKN